MKSVRSIIIAVAVSLTATAFAQSDPHQHNDPVAQAQKTAPKPKTEAQLSFDELKQLAGEWQGHVSLNPPMKGMGDTELHVTMRVTSRGNTITHEFQEADKPLDWTKYDHPITMFYLADDGQLNLTHYCDAGNRPRMVAKKLADGKIDFTFADITGPTKYGNMYHSTFIPIDADHHIEEWTFKLPGDKLMVARMDLHRVPTQTAAK